MLSGADCDSDHSLLALWMKLKRKKFKKSKVILIYDFKLLAARNNEIQEDYNINVENRFECLQELDDLNACWQQIRDIIADSEIIPRKEQKAKQKWVTAEIWISWLIEELLNNAKIQRSRRKR